MVEIANLPAVLDVQHGKHYQDCLEGRVFSQATTPLGLAYQVYTDTNLTDSLPIWNPSNSKVNVELISFTTGKVSGTSDFFTIVLMARTGLGTDVAGGSEITAFVETTPFNGLLGAGQKSQVKSSNAGTCTMSAGVAAEAVRSLFGTGIPGDATTDGINYGHIDFDGTILVPPGAMVWVAATKAAVALYASTIVWKEVPIR